MIAAFVIKREAVIERVFFQNRLLPLQEAGRLSSFLRPSQFIFRPTMLYFCATLRRWRASVAREIGAWLFVVVRECNRTRSLTLPRRPIGFEIGRKNDMLGQNDRAIAKQSHGAHGV